MNYYQEKILVLFKVINMRNVYKYTSIKYIESTIKNGVYASVLDDVNDPYECDGILYPDLFRICCMTTSPNNMLLWSYYANGHKGCSIQVEIPDEINREYELVRRVKYSNIKKNVKKKNNEEIAELLYRKNIRWKHENEIRAVYYKDRNHSNFWNIIDNTVYLNVPVKSISFGYLAEKDRDYLKVLKFLDSYNKGLKYKDHKITVKKYSLHENKYRIVLNSQFLCDKEINRIESNKNLREMYND